jgi:prophage tail gpP-like protein
LSSTYKARGGETFEVIARRAYGTEQNASRIRAANPFAFEPVPPGTVLTIPDDIAGAPAVDPATTPEGITVTIGGTDLRAWQAFRYTEALDGVQTFTVSAPFTDTVRPLEFAATRVYADNTKIFEGHAVGVSPLVTPGEESVEITGYSRPGTLMDCVASAGAYPVEFKNMTLAAIAKQLAEPFGVRVSAGLDAGAAFKKVSLSADRKIWAFLTELAQQRGTLLRSNAAGDLVIAKGPTFAVPVAALSQGAPPLIAVRPSFNPQQYFGHVTGVEPTKFGRVGESHTVENPFARDNPRPFTFVVPDAEKADVRTATEAKAARMFASAASYSVDVMTWRTPAGALWSAGDFVTLKAPAAYIADDFPFVIRAVTLNATPDSQTATLDLALPEAFSGTMPRAVPWAV